LYDGISVKKENIIMCDDTLTLLAVHAACERCEKAGHTYDAMEFAMRDIRMSLGRIGGGTLPNRFYKSRKRCEDLNEQFKLLRKTCEEGEYELAQILSMTKVEFDPLMIALAEARHRGRKKSDDILSQNDMLTSEDFAKYIGITTNELFSKVERYEVIALYSDTKLRFPRWQVDSLYKPYKSFPALFAELSYSPWAVYRFLCQNHSETNKTGLELLTAGKWNDILDIIECL
jgi:hypothetical protein